MTMNTYTISDKTRQEILKVFENNHRIELEYFKNKKTSKEREVEYLEESKTNPNIPLHCLIYKTMTGIEQQIKNASDNFPVGFYLEYNEPPYIDYEFIMKKFLIQKLDFNEE